mmetsp:Transcript_3921/g.5536  ORF Transcript_3921/g.5536 Transcript_3921/m.5536 type:complete len:204 (-) Transcript_3921:1413-2024(-)
MAKTTAVSTATDTTDILCGDFLLVQIRHHRWDPLFRFYQDLLQIKENSLRRRRIYKCRRYTRLSLPARSPDSVYIIFYFLGHVVIDNVLDIRKIQPFRSDIGCNKHILLPFPKFSHRLFPLLLILSSMNTNSLHSFQKQILVDIINVALVLTKYKHWWGRFLQALQQIHNLCLLPHEFYLLYDIQIRSASPSHIYNDWFHKST